MSRQITITCDACGADLDKSGERTRSRLRLEDERILAEEPGRNRPADPILDEDAYFCGLPCLGTWLSKTKKEESSLP